MSNKPVVSPLLSDTWTDAPRELEVRKMLSKMYYEGPQEFDGSDLSERALQKALDAAPEDGEDGRSEWEALITWAWAAHYALETFQELLLYAHEDPPLCETCGNPPREKKIPETVEDHRRARALKRAGIDPRRYGFSW